VLEGLYQGAREDALAREALLPLPEVKARAREATTVRDLSTLEPRVSVHVIAEIKRRSPSKGQLAGIADPVALARSYEAGGASVISVLTEERQFGGSLDDLDAVSRAVTIPVLRKDFIETEYQVVEARAHGADLVLLIMAGLDDSTVARLLQVTRSWGMEALVETHSEQEVLRAVALGATIIGINARDLTTFELDPGLFGRLVHLIPPEVFTVAESAVVNSQDVTRYREDGAHAVLVGEALVTGSDPERTVREFVKA
jgi:indole-3-glycerol phosphate synthase